jgi:hypothetical protein
MSIKEEICKKINDIPEDKLPALLEDVSKLAFDASNEKCYMIVLISQTKKTQGYSVKLEQHHAPTIIHLSKSEALGELKRLAEKNRQTFLLFESAAIVDGVQQIINEI